MSSMKGHILISMPHLSDPYFNRSLVIICDHDKEGAMGLIFNKSFEDESIKQIFPTLIINDEAISELISPMYFAWYLTSMCISPVELMWKTLVTVDVVLSNQPILNYPLNTCQHKCLYI